jgi:ribosome-binding ATPase YchF (GTP1/OBG family)
MLKARVVGLPYDGKSTPFNAITRTRKAQAAYSRPAPLDHMGSVGAARDKGLYRMEGKESVVKDGDVLLFKFNV